MKTQKRDRILLTYTNDLKIGDTNPHADDLKPNLWQCWRLSFLPHDLSRVRLVVVRDRTDLDVHEARVLEPLRYILQF